MTEQQHEMAQDAGRLICKIRENGYVRQRGDWIDISEDGMTGHCYVSVGQLPRWIPVEERLPVHSGTYFVRIEAGSIDKEIRHAVLPWRNGKFPAMDWMKVTHWMPILEAE